MRQSFRLERVQCGPDGRYPELGARHAEPLGELVGRQGTFSPQRVQHAADGGGKLPRGVGELAGGLLVDVLEEVPRKRPAVGARHGEDQIAGVAAGGELPTDRLDDLRR